jgi:hypothetical protein
MDLRRLRGGEVLAGVSAVGLLIAMFLEWFGGDSAWETLTVGDLLLVSVALLGLTLVVLTAQARAVAMAASAAVLTIGVAMVVLLYLLFRIVINEPGPDAAGEIGVGAYLGLVFVFGCAAGAWRALGDERTDSAYARRQTERVLAVRGAPRPPPPERAPSRSTPPTG